MYHSTISLIIPSIEEKKHFYIALGSFFDEKLYILKVPNDYNTPMLLSSTINVKNYPSACSWNGRTFWIGCQNGILCSFTPSRGQKEEKNESFPHAVWETSLTSISNICPASKGEYLILSSLDNNLLRLFSVQTESNSTTYSSVLGEQPLKLRNAYKDSEVHTDMVVCLCVSPNSTFLATGCVDGSIHVWNIINGEMKLIAKANIHNLAILSLSFSPDSSLLMSCAADGSVFILTVSEPSRLFFKASLGGLSCVSMCING